MTLWLRLRWILGWTGFLGSVALLCVVGYLYPSQPDHFAAFTVIPVWMWGMGGMLASGIAIVWLRASWGLAVAAAWMVMLFSVADEARVLRNFFDAAPEPGSATTHQGKPVIRVITANCDTQVLSELVEWKPDVVFLQDVWPHQAAQIARELYGKNAQIHTHETNAIVTRWKIVKSTAFVGQRAQMASIKVPGGRMIVCVNAHLLSAATDLRFWRRAVWTEHRVNRAARINELGSILARVDPLVAEVPVLFAGDFNAPPDDPVYRMFEPRFLDAHREAGKRWGNTYHREVPVLRIDRIHATRHFAAVRCATHVAKTSNHRFVVADFVLEDGN